MDNLPNELPDNLPKQIRLAYRQAFTQLSELYSAKEIAEFVRRAASSYMRHIGANGLTGESIHTPRPDIPTRAIASTWELLRALHDADNVRDFGIANYLGKGTVALLRSEDQRAKASKKSGHQGKLKHAVRRLLKILADEGLNKNLHQLLLKLSDKESMADLAYARDDPILIQSPEVDMDKKVVVYSLPPPKSSQRTVTFKRLGNLISEINKEKR